MLRVLFLQRKFDMSWYIDRDKIESMASGPHRTTLAV